MTIVVLDGKEARVLTGPDKPLDTITHTHYPVVSEDQKSYTWATRLKTEAELATEVFEQAVRQEQSNAEQLRTDTSADLVKLKAAVEELKTLLGDNTTVGSIRTWRSSVNNTYDRDTMRALADLLITQTQANRRVARQVLRLAKEMVGDYGDADVGSE